MKLALYTALRNGFRNDYPFLAMLRHHLPLVDEIVVNEGYSTDGSYEAIRDLDPKIRIIRTRWDRPRGEEWWIHFKDAARRATTADWCLHLDVDEFLVDWEFDRLREYLESTDDVLIPVKFVNFYGNFRIYHPNPGKARWVTRKMIIHRNRPDVEFWGDGSNLKLQGVPFRWETSQREFTVHHFGAVKDPGILRSLQWEAGRFRSGRSTWWRPPRFVFKMFPYNWLDPDYLDDLAIYDGPLIQAVRVNPDQFIRDGMKLLQHLEKKRSPGVNSSAPALTT